jgi:hypothetical protein
LSSRLALRTIFITIFMALAAKAAEYDVLKILNGMPLAI